MSSSDIVQMTRATVSRRRLLHRPLPLARRPERRLRPGLALRSEHAAGQGVPPAVLERTVLQRARQDRGRRAEARPHARGDCAPLDLTPQLAQARVWGRGAHRGVEREAYRTGPLVVFLFDVWMCVGGDGC